MLFSHSDGYYQDCEFLALKMSKIQKRANKIRQHMLKFPLKIQYYIIKKSLLNKLKACFYYYENVDRQAKNVLKRNEW